MLHQNTFCNTCGLYAEVHSPALLGRGSDNPEVMIFGEACGKNEDEKGIVFVGDSGQELDSCLASAGYEDSFYRIENAVKCRPTSVSTDRQGRITKSNRTPTPKEVQCCKPHSIRLIRKYKPKVIVTLGAIPLSQILPVDVSLNLARGRSYFHSQLNCYVIPTYHPSYLLRTHDAQYKKELIEDLKFAKQLALLGTPRKIQKNLRSLKDPLDIKEYLNELNTSKEFSCDLETTGLNHRKDRITDINLCCEIGKGVHIDWQLMVPFYEDLKSIMENPSIGKVCHNGKFDIKFLRAIGILVKNYAFDTMTGYHTLTMSFEGEGKGLYTLKNLAGILTTEGGYDVIMDEFGGISNYQKAKYNIDTLKKKKTAKEKVVKEKAIKAPTVTKANTPIACTPDITTNTLFDCDTPTVTSNVLDKFKHLSTDKDTSVIDQFSVRAETRALVRAEKANVAIRMLEEKIQEQEKVLTRVITPDVAVSPIQEFDGLLESELQECSTYIEDCIKKDAETNKLTPLEYYSAMDADVTLRCKYKIEQELEKYPKQKWVYNNLIMPLSNVLLRMEENGLLLDFDHMNKIREENVKECERLTKKLYDKAGYEFNIDSNDDLRHFIYEHLKIPVDPEYMTAGGKSGNKKPSTDVDAIEHFAKKHAILKHIVEYRKLQKETNTYIDGWMKIADPTTHRVYPSFLQHTAATGRLSSANPNAQNVPRSDRIRNMVIAPEGSKLISCDLSQAELRILALISQDTRMLEAFNSGMDFHAMTACLMFRIDPKDFDKENNPTHAKYRTVSKTVNFGVAYGRGPQSLVEQLGISLEEAKNFIETFFKTYKHAKQWMDDTQAFAMRYGYVETLHGRRRYLPSAFSSNDALRSRALRQAINTPIQGTASDCACFGLIKMQDYLDARPELKSMLVGVVHDEILVEAPDAEVETIVGILPKFMTEDIPLVTIPLEADAKILQKWSK